MRAPRSTPTAAAPQRGLSLVELMVGVAVGLFITAAASMLVSTQLAGNRQLLVETQIQQDLRATADVVVRELRRASYAANAETFIALPHINVAPSQNWGAAISLSSDASGSTEVRYQYKLDTNVFGLRVAGGVLQRLGGSSGWQPLTDANVLRIDQFVVTPSTDTVSERLACPALCADGGTTCWPTIEVRELGIAIVGTSATGSPVTRSVQATVRVRNDVVSFNQVTPAGPVVCP